MTYMTIFDAKYLFILPIVLLGLYFLRRHRWKDQRLIAFALSSMIFTYLIALLAGNLYSDPRPFVEEHFTPLISHAPDNGFPSDHALLVSAIAAVGMYSIESLDWSFGCLHLWSLQRVLQ